MPRRSTGCEKCRQRKVRCDEGKPHCKRCSDYGITCPGYRLPAEKDLQFVDQTSKVVGRNGAATHVSASFLGFASKANAHGQNGSTEFRWRHQFSGELVRLPSPSTVNNRHIHRAQLLSTFLDLYLPKRRDGSMMSHFTYITALPSVDLSSPLLQISIDTLCLAELGSLHNDERCLQESRGRYVRALPMLSSELTKPRRVQLRKDHLCAVISILALCELFDALAKGAQGGKGWISHVQGAQTYMKHHHRDILNSPFGWMLFHNIRHMSLCMSMIRRQASYFAEPEWLKLTQNDAEHDPYVALYDLCIQVPGILERADNLASSGSFDSDFFDVCRTTLRLRAELESWMTHHQLNRGGAKYRIVDVRDMEEFARLCLNRTYITVFRFPTVQICSQYQLFWVTCLMLDFTVANIYRVYGSAHDLPDLSLFTSRSRPGIWRDMYVAATNYCRCVPYCCDPETSSIGRIGTFLLRITASFFEIAGFKRELDWCNDIRKMLQEHALSQQSSASATSSSPTRDDERQTYDGVAPSREGDDSSIASRSTESSLESQPASSLPLPIAVQAASTKPNNTVSPLPRHTHIRLQGAYPDSSYTPRAPSTPSASASTSTIQNALPTSLLHRLPTSSVVEANRRPPSGFHLLNTSAVAKRLSNDPVAVPTAANPPFPCINGASMLADEHMVQGNTITLTGTRNRSQPTPRQPPSSSCASASASFISPNPRSPPRIPLSPLSNTRVPQNKANDMAAPSATQQKSIDMTDGTEPSIDRDQLSHDPFSPPSGDLVSCSDDFMGAAVLDRCLLGTADRVLDPDGRPRAGPIGGTCF